MYILLFDLDILKEANPKGLYYSIDNKRSAFLTTSFGSATVMYDDECYESLIKTIKQNIILELKLMHDKDGNLNISNSKKMFTSTEIMLVETIIVTTINRLDSVGIKFSKKIDIDYIIDVLEANDYWCKKIPIDPLALLAAI